MRRTIGVEVDASTFPGGVPTYLSSGSTSINLRSAFALLGSVTVPGGYSTASPAAHWAWVRYELAIDSNSDLRITSDFADLDPHQKAVLSDDFGVAIGAQWLYDRLGGFLDIVDGRRFVQQYVSLASGLSIPTAKVGPRKCPDFVALDHFGKWHVIECKGTQAKGLDEQLTRAVEQKEGISVDPAIQGLSLATGLYIASSATKKNSKLRVVDPPAGKLIHISGANAHQAKQAIKRLSASRALGLAGFNDLARQLSLPPKRLRVLDNLYTAYEKRMLLEPEQKRLSREIDELRTGVKATVEHTPFGRPTYGREGEFLLPKKGASGAEPNRYRVRQGINPDLIDEITATSPDSLEEFDYVISNIYDESGVVITEDVGRLEIRVNNLFFLEVTSAT